MFQLIKDRNLFLALATIVFIDQAEPNAIAVETEYGKSNITLYSVINKIHINPQGSHMGNMVSMDLKVIWLSK